MRLPARTPYGEPIVKGTFYYSNNDTIQGIRQPNSVSR